MMENIITEKRCKTCTLTKNVGEFYKIATLKIVFTAFVKIVMKKSAKKEKY